jgi:SHS2 domain-containing protein
MPYRYLEDIAIADVAFEAQEKTIEELFVTAGDALMNVMVDNLDGIQEVEHQTFQIKAEDLERLLFEYLQDIIYLKDAEQLLVRARQIFITYEGGFYNLRAEVSGEKINPSRHELNADVKAVTLHRFEVKVDSEGWKATVVLDI